VEARGFSPAKKAAISGGRALALGFDKNATREN
jgi:hypothetical protein